MPKGFKTGHYVQQDGYKSYTPAKLNSNLCDFKELAGIVSEASYLLGKVAGICLMAKEKNRYLWGNYVHEYVQEEAKYSSYIEGLRDGRSIHNCEVAHHHGMKNKENLPFSTRLVRKIHKFLLLDRPVKLPGELRQCQNWVGGKTPQEAIYVPPHHSEISDLLNDLENFWHDPDKSPLISCALIHYQFEAIHPFLDGNGRVGRILIPMFLKDCGYLKYPILCYSKYLWENRNRYYQELSRVREENSYISWCEFFLEGIIKRVESILAFLGGSFCATSNISQEDIEWADKVLRKKEK